MYKFTFKYTSGKDLVKMFSSIKEGIEWAHSEGDHLLEYTYENI